LTTLCRGCKALIIPADDEYNLYSLQRAIYPVDPLMTLPQPTSWVTLTCEDGYVVKKLYSQNDDWVVFWQQMLAECENHKNAEPESPTVITPPGEDVEDDQTPDLPPKPDPKPDPMPGPDTVVEPPSPAPPTPEPTPSDPGSAWLVPPGAPPPTPKKPGDPAITPPTDKDLPALDAGKVWHTLAIEFICHAFNDSSDAEKPGAAITQAACVYLKDYADELLKVQSVQHPLYAWWSVSEWQWLTGQGSGARKDAYGTFANRGYLPYDNDLWTQTGNVSQYHQLSATLHLKWQDTP
jgi:hypothetical protein